MHTFDELVECILLEIAAGGEGSAFGPGVAATSTHFSADTYAPSDARVAKIIGKKVIKRNMPKNTVFTGKTSRKKSKARRRKHKKQ